MELTLKNKEEIARLVVLQQEESGLSQARFAVSIGFTSSDLSNLKTGAWKANQQLIGDRKWLSMARRVDFNPKGNENWKTAQTEVFTHITSQLTLCQQYSFCNIFCDAAGIGKTHACEWFSKNNKNVFYINCSTSSNKNKFIAEFARKLGLSRGSSTYDDLLDDAIYSLKCTEKPLVILDEAGDLEDKVYQVIKRIYNDLEHVCGIYIVGADSLEKRIERGISSKKVAFTEVFSRFGGAFSVISPTGEEYLPFISTMGVQILIENGYNQIEADSIINKIKGRKTNNIRGLRRIDLRNVYKAAYLEREH